MVANVNAVNAAQNKPAAHQAASSGAAGQGAASQAMSFVTMLNNEIHAAAPPTPTPAAAPVVQKTAHPASPAPKDRTVSAGHNGTGAASGSGKAGDGNTAGDSSGNAAASSNSTPAASADNGTVANGKKISKSAAGQSDTTTSPTDAAAATAATAAALAVLTANNGAAASSAGAENSASAAATGVNNAANNAANNATASDPLTAIAANAATAATPVAPAGTNAVHDPKASATTALTATQTANGKAAAPIAAQTAVAVNPAKSTGKNTGQQSETFASTLNKAVLPEAGTGNKNSSIMPAQPAAGAQTSATPITAPAANLTAPLSGNAANADTSLQSIKSVNQNLSDAQMNAMAPILAMPANNLPRTESADTITTPVSSPNWDQAVGQKINWMVSGGQQSASLTLNPPDLGPLQVVLSLNNQHANATFISHHPEVRAALENAIPKLREMMSQSGIQLGDCNVNSQARQDFAQNQAQSNSGRTSISDLGNPIGAVTGNSGVIQRAGTGLVDTFV
ncbi:flagellar hook-length control protein FliK [Oxalobacteraceae bacterium GrIS 2.11]